MLRRFFVTLVVLFGYLALCPAQPAGHPRFLLLAGEEQQIKDNIANDKVWAKVHEAIMSESDKMLALPELKREVTKAGRMLSVSIETVRRMLYLGYAWRMTGEDKYFQKARKDLLTVSAFEDWHPIHFLDVSEMTFAVAAGYDCFFSLLSEQERSIIKDAILKKGLEPSLNSSYNWWLKDNANWNQNCNNGMAYGALAIYEDETELAKTIIDRSLQSIQLPMKGYAPDGASVEGRHYWATEYNILFLDAIEKNFGTDYGLASIPGFLESVYYAEQMICPSHFCFNYSDCEAGERRVNPAMFWYAARLNDPSLLWNEKYDLENLPVFTGAYSWTPVLMFWGRGIKLEKVTPPKKRFWIGRGITPVAVMRTSWTDSNAIFVGYKGGKASTSHSHIDAGSFIMEADGVRWATDPGSQGYGSAEVNLSSRGAFWDMSQNSERWTMFRLNNRSHNTLTVDNKLHNVKGFADIRSFSDKVDFMNVTSDISDVFSGQLASAVRGVAIVGEQYVVVRDEIKTLDKETTIRWSLFTEATATLSEKDNAINFSKDGKTMRLEVVQPAKVNLKTWSTVPENSYEDRNDGTMLVGFEVQLPANTEASFVVKLIPQSAKKTKATVPDLSRWPKNN
ncbi:MAG: hypothetical protein EZS26_003260 [Candidatus Ordinivivax streblomastigis]|uniref:Heparinase II/III-like C-terminal domain-containing protein n=1 Tax=Candidatus Ordinivivax streblomastigis TaxID=2540710 RepID=A0A5M8NV56_9BACT|nr:MAG: hypothetical protein EZS26_003260 [Candidatus Ordinivivax streblomastigis]